MRIVAFGDSITLGVRPDGSVKEEQTWRVLLAKRLNASGKKKWEIINAGIGGNTTADGMKRLDSDVLSKKPDLVTIMFGVNDAAMLSFPDFKPISRPRVALEEYKKNLATMIERVRQAGARVILMTPVPMGNKYFNRHLEPYKSHDHNYMLRSYMHAVRELAQQLNVEIVDVWLRFFQEGINELLPDGVHPNPRGHQIIADMLFHQIISQPSSPTPFPKILNVSKSLALYEEAQRLIPSGSQTLSKRAQNFAYGAYPIYVERAAGAHVWDVDGNEYIDYVMGLGPITLGYNYPRVNQAIEEQLRKGIIYGLISPLEVEAAREIIDAVPCAEMVRFLKGGAEATSAAVRVARAHTKRELILSEGYHGWHDQWTAQRNDGGVPKCLEGTIIGFSYNDLARLEKLFAGHPNQVAAVILCPVMRDLPKDGFLEKVNDLAHRNGALVIWDEIVTGFRLARGGAQEYFGIKPDLACFAKGIANGMPVSAVVGRRDVMETMSKCLISVTYGGEALSLAALVAALREYREKGDVFKYIWKQGKRLEEGLNEAAQRHGFPPLASGLAPMGVMTLVPESGVDADTMWFYFLQECAARGVLMRRGGCNFITYSHTDADIQKTIDVVDEVLGQMRKHLKQGDLAKQLRRRSPEAAQDIRVR